MCCFFEHALFQISHPVSHRTVCYFTVSWRDGHSSLAFHGMVVAYQIFLEMSLPIESIVMTYRFPFMWRKVLEVTVLMMCNFSQPFWWLGLSIGPTGVLMESLLKPVDLGLGILVGIFCLHTALILNQTTATTTKTKSSYWYIWKKSGHFSR